MARAILSDKGGEFQLRAITRKPDSDGGRELSAQGAEVVAANLDDVATLRRAFAGADGAFCVTNYWEHFSPDKEIQQARNLALASQGRQGGARHLVDTR